MDGLRGQRPLSHERDTHRLAPITTQSVNIKQKTPPLYLKYFKTEEERRETREERDQRTLQTLFFSKPSVDESFKFCSFFNTLKTKPFFQIPMSEKLVFRRSSGGGEWQWHGNLNGKYLEKRQMFLRSYHFSRKQSLSEKVTASVRRVKRVVWTKLRSARRFKRVVWSRLRSAFFYRRRRFFRLLHPHEPSYCF